MKRTLILPLVAAVLVTGCGGKSTSSSSAGGTTTSSTSTSAAASGNTGASAGDCNALGINPSQMHEGTCTHQGFTYVIVDENHILKLKTLWARLEGVRTAKSVTSGSGSATAQGKFVIVSLTITNKLPAPQTFDQAQTQQAGLILEGGRFNEAVRAESPADPNSCLARHRTPIKADQSETCDTIFDVPASAAAALGKHGSGDLYLVDFGSDLAGSVFPQTIGQIRLYH